MGTRRRYKQNGKKAVASFVMFQHRLLQDPGFLKLSPNACKALLFLASQFKGNNNGDLTIAWKIAKDKGFTSNGALRLATRELVDAGFVVETRMGGRNRCSLFALAWFAIDECGGKPDVLPTIRCTERLAAEKNFPEPAAVRNVAPDGSIGPTPQRGQHSTVYGSVRAFSRSQLNQ